MKKKFPPDWKDPSAYPDPETLTLQQWAWEFLRRNPDYQADYEKVINLPEWYPTILLSNPKLENYICDPAAYPDESFEAYKKRCEEKGLDYKVQWLGHFYSEKWGLKCSLPNPEDDQPIDLEFEPIEPVRVLDISTEFMVDEDGFIIWREDKEGHLILTFDLTKPTKTLLKQAEQHIKRHKEPLFGKRKESFRFHVANFKKYIRLLDAEAQGAEIPEMASEIFSEVENEYPDFIGSQRVRDSLEAARKLRNHTYRYLSSKK